MGSPIKGYRVGGLTALSTVCVAALVLAACEGGGFEPGTPQVEANPIWEPGEHRSGSIIGSQGRLLFGVESADPFGGVIITDWHAPPETPGERFKLNVYILGRALRAA